MYRVFGTEESPQATALAKALWEVAKGNNVPTRSGTSGATFKQGIGSWILHNSAWWDWGGAHRVVARAAQILAKESPGLGKEVGSLTVAGQVITCVEHDHNDHSWQDPSAEEALVWDVVSSSRNAWLSQKAS